MKTKRLITAVLVTALVISAFGCGGGDKRTQAKKLAQEMRAVMLTAGDISLNAAIRADYGERIYDFVISFGGSAESGNIEIIKPDTIAGMKAAVSKNGTEIRWTDAVLDVGSITEEISPAAIIPILIHEWREGYITSQSLSRTAEKAERLTVKTYRANQDISNELAFISVFETEDMLPVSAEVYVSGRRVLTIAFSRVKLK